MNQRNYRSYQDNAQNYLENVGRRFVFNPSSDLYTPQSYAAESQREHRRHGSSRNSPFFVDPATRWAPTWIPVIISLVTLAVIAWYTYVTQGIWQNTQTGTIATVTSSWAARESADDATKMVADSDKYFHIEERPYVVVNVLLDMPLIFDRESTVDVRMDNSGKTPALHVHSTAKLYIDGKEFAFQPRTKIKSKEGTSQVIGSGLFGSHVYGIKLQVSPPDALKPDISKTDIRIKGTVTYDDIFHESHKTTFCVNYESVHGVFAFCDNGNEVE